MKKTKFGICLLTCLTVVVLFCTSCAKPGDGSGSSTNLSDIYNSALAFEDAEAVSFEASASVELKLDSSIMQGAPAEVTSVLDQFKKSNGAYEVKVTLSGTGSAQSGTIKLAYGTGNSMQTLTTVLIADGGLYVNVKEAYEAVRSLMVANGASSNWLPSWPYTNEYADVSELYGSGSGYEVNYYSDYDDYNDYEASDYSRGGLDGVLENLEMVEKVLDAIPETTINDLFALVEDGLRNSGALSSKDGYFTLSLTPATIEKMPGAMADALDGKLAPLLESVFKGVLESGVIPTDEKPTDDEIRSQAEEGAKQIVSALREMDVHDADGLGEMLTTMQENNIIVNVGIRAHGTEVGVRADISASQQGNSVRMSASFSMRTASKVSVTKPQNVLTESEMEDFTEMLGNVMG